MRSAAVVLTLFLGCSSSNEASSPKNQQVDSGPIGCTEGCEPRVIATGLAVPDRLRVDDNAVYFLEFGTVGTIKSVPKAGGTITTLATDAEVPIDLAVDATHVYWTLQNRGAVVRVPKAGGAPVTVAAAGWTSGSGGRLAVDETHIYWASGNRIASAPKAGGGKVVSVDIGARATGIAVDKTDVVYSCACADFTAWRRPKTLDGDAVGLVPAAPGGLRDLAIDDTALYVARTSPDSGATLIASVPGAGGELTVLHNTTSETGSLLVDARHLYSVTKADGPFRLPKAGGAPEKLLTGLVAPRSVAIDAHYVYVADAADKVSGTITRVGK